MRGENPYIRGQTVAIDGTSPRARGKQSNVFIEKTLVRNIPACAGKTGTSIVFARAQSEHPRVRGENTPR